LSAPAFLLMLAGPSSTCVELVSAVSGQDSNGIFGASPLPAVQLAFLILLTGFAGLVHIDLVVWPDQRPSSRIDAPSLVLIAMVSCVCLLASLWAVLSGTDLGANLL
jgi:hypothetical protein